MEYLNILWVFIFPIKIVFYFNPLSIILLMIIIIIIKLFDHITLSSMFMVGMVLDGCTRVLSVFETFRL